MNTHFSAALSCAHVFARIESALIANSRFPARPEHANFCGMALHHAPINAPRCNLVRAASLTFAPMHPTPLFTKGGAVVQRCRGFGAKNFGPGQCRNSGLDPWPNRNPQFFANT